MDTAHRPDLDPSDLCSCTSHADAARRPDADRAIARATRRLTDARSSLAKYERLDSESRAQHTVRLRSGDTQWTDEVHYWRARVEEHEAELARAEAGRG